LCPWDIQYFGGLVPREPFFIRHRSLIPHSPNDPNTGYIFIIGQFSVHHPRNNITIS
jgi:hypothetical protein